MKAKLKNNAFVVELIMAKSIALVLGVVVLLLLRDSSETGSLKSWALVLWYPTIAGIATVASLVDAIPIRTMQPIRWAYPPLIGAWMNLILCVFAGQTMQDYSVTIYLSSGVLTSHYWFIVDGVAIGALASLVSLTRNRLNGISSSGNELL